MGRQCQITLLLVVLTAGVKTTSAFLFHSHQCVAPPPCYCMSYDVDCFRKALTNVPKFIYVNNSDYISDLTVNLFNNHITVIPSNVFRNLSSVNTSLINFDLQDNMISTIDINAFSGIENKTTSLNLRNNKLTGLPSALQKLNKLQTLYIEGNPIVSLDAPVSLQLSQYLTTFGFDMGQFKNWPTELSMLHLQELIIRKIPFSHLPLNAFAGSEPTLTRLTLSQSKLVRIPSAVCHLQNLRMLYFIGNVNIESNVTLFEHCPHNLTHLTTLKLDDDNLLAFPDVMQYFQWLAVLQLVGNKIQFDNVNISPDSNKLTLLDMQQNKLTRIPSALNKLKTLERLWLNGNQISTVEDNDLVGLPMLRDLSLASNPIKYVSPHAFAGNMLSSLDLEDTRLHLIPEAVMYLPQLGSLSFDLNNVDCSCRMSYLKGWNMTAISWFSGKCANQNSEIKQFILTQLPSCP